MNKSKEYIKRTDYDNVSVVENSDYEWGVIDSNGNIIVPFGKYGWIDGFDSGLARVRTKKDPGIVGNTIAIVDLNDGNSIEGKENIELFYENDRIKHPEKYAKWGIINEFGEEVLPLIYDRIWNFLGKNRKSTTVEKDGYSSLIFFKDLNPSLQSEEPYDYYEENVSHYGEFEGSYAQDVMGYSDEDINDAFDGDPDAYWNID